MRVVTCSIFTLILLAVTGCPPAPGTAISLMVEGRYLGTSTGTETRFVNNAQVSVRNRDQSLDFQVDARGQLKTNFGADVESGRSLNFNDGQAEYVLTVSGVQYNADGATVNLRLLVTPNDGSDPLDGDATIVFEQINDTTLRYTQTYEVATADGRTVLRGTMNGELEQ